MRTAVSITLNEKERRTLRRWARQDDARLARRARIVLLAAKRWSNNDIADKLETDPHTVARWRNRFADQGLGGVEEEAPRSGRRRSKRSRVEQRILRRVARHIERRQPWSYRELAELLGVNHMMVYRILREHDLSASPRPGASPLTTP